MLNLEVVSQNNMHAKSAQNTFQSPYMERKTGMACLSIHANAMHSKYNAKNIGMPTGMNAKSAKNVSSINGIFGIFHIGRKKMPFMTLISVKSVLYHPSCCISEGAFLPG
jgi:hypothetical protein